MLRHMHINIYFSIHVKSCPLFNEGYFTSQDPTINQILLGIFIHEEFYAFNYIFKSALQCHQSYIQCLTNPTKNQTWILDCYYCDKSVGVLKVRIVLDFRSGNGNGRRMLAEEKGFSAIMIG